MKHKFSTVETGKDNSCCGCCYCSKTQKRAACTLVWTPIVLFLLFIIGLLIRTALIESPFALKRLSEDSPKFMNLSSSLKLVMAERLGRAIQIRTISINETTLNTTALAEMHSLLTSTFDRVFKSDFITVQRVNTYSLLLRIEGTIATRNPYMLCGHLDVVPEGNGNWSHPPFLGEIINEDGEDFVFGRGTIDDKQSVMGILEALDYMVKEGTQPNRTFYVAFGHDEEVSGYQGAANIAKVLKKSLQDHGETLAFILDEGMFVMDGVFPGVSDPVAYVGVVEKGWANVELSVSGVQGHSRYENQSQKELVTRTNRSKANDGQQQP
jgi:carboxypeptidase PM20D1